MEDSNYRYFIYSKSQMKERREIESRIGRTFIPGEVVVGARKFQYTEMSTTGKSRYSDAKIVARGNIKNMVYTRINSGA